MPTPENVVIVGAGLAGAKAAETLRGEGFEGAVTLIGEEPVRPYERPPLSKDYLRGEVDFDGPAVHDAEFYATNAIDLRLSTVVDGVDPAASRVTLASGEQIAYDRLLLTTGAAPRHLSVPGSHLRGVHYLRTVADSDAIRLAVSRSLPVVVIGAGWIGCEVAASARQLGAEITVVDMAGVPLERVLGPDVGEIFRDLHVDHGVEFRLGVGIDSLEGEVDVEEVRLTDGTVIPAGVVVAGVGVSPRIELGESAGLEMDNGIVTDEFLETSVAGIYAAGDVANAFHPVYGHHIRLEHWSSALNQGPAAARNMLGAGVAYTKVPYFYSDQYEFGMEYRGLATSSDEVVFRGKPTDGAFIAFWVRDGRVLAAMNANVWDQGDQIEALLSAGGLVDRARLADPGVDVGAVTVPG